MFRWFLPKDGGGHVRRYLRFRKEVLNRIMNSKDRYPCPPITLFDFARQDDAIDAAKVQAKDRDSWRISDDRVIGGFSESLARLIRSDDEYRRYVSGESGEQPTNDVASSDDVDSNNNFTPFIRWSGKIDTTIGLRSNAQRSGFAALRSPIFPMDGANLQGL